MVARQVLAWTTWHGRLRRRTFLWKSATVALVFIVLFVFMQRAMGRDSTLVLYLPLFVVSLSLLVRRLHDQARSAWWLLALLVPVAGPLLVAALLLFKRGTEGGNQYGHDPRLVGRDYLKVAVHEPA